MKKKLYRSRSNKVLCGVLGGLADYLDMDATILRVIYVLLSIFILGSPIVLYFIFVLIIPQEPEYPDNQPPQPGNYEPYNENRD